MLAGIRGGLVSEYFAEYHLSERFGGRLGEADRGAALTALARINRGTAPLGPASSTRAMFDVAAAPLAELLGFRVMSVAPVTARRGAAVGRHRADLLAEPPAVVATLERHPGARVALLVVPWAADLEAAWRQGVLAGIDAAARWCLLFNARKLRVLDSWRTYNRDHLEFDIETVASDPRSFAVFWSLVRADAFVAVPGASSLFEAVVRLSAEHSVAVCRSLRGGVLESLKALMQGLANPRQRHVATDALFEQSLTLVYRMLFLLFAEARRLLPTWNPLYSEAYSIETLRTQADSADSRSWVGLWESFQAISRLAHHGCRAGSLEVTPFNGRLFSPSRTPLGESARVHDEIARKAIGALSTTQPAKAGRGRARIAYQDLGVEQLGAVYESVLDYQPRIERSGRGPAVVHLEPGSGRRKASGSFYTPRALTGYLVRRTLHPLVSGRTPDDILRLRVLDPAMGSAAFLVSACHYLASAYEKALVDHGHCHPSDIDDRDRARFRRTVAERCLYGVDLNPMAVQLARLSLWLATLSADQPLTFLDHHLAIGDSLVGATVFDVLRAPTRGPSARSRRGNDFHPTLFDADEWRSDLGRVLPERLRLALEPGDTLQAVRQKERALEALAAGDAPGARWKQAADAWCACWFRNGHPPPSRGVYHELLDAIIVNRTHLRPKALDRLLEDSRAIALSRRFFHWQIEFPEVFFDESGQLLDNPGFDAVIGNPPWDMLRADGASSPGNQAYDRQLLEFARASHIYTAQSDGHANRFQLFVDRAFQLTRRGGRLGLVLPWGLFADRGCAPLRRRLFLEADTDTIVGFNNGNAIFPIHRSIRFALATTTCGGRTTLTRCRFGEHDVSILDGFDDEGPGTAALTISPALLERVSGDDLAVPDVRTAVDLEILEHVSSAFPWLSSSRGWNARFGRELNASDDRPHFVAAFPESQRIDDEMLAVIEGKHLEPFAAHVGAARHAIRASVAGRLLGGRTSFREWRLAYRDVASATNRVTLIAGMLPPGCVSTHTLFCLRTALDEQSRWFLCGVMNSYVANYLVRLRVTTHVSAGIVERLPVPFEDVHEGAGFEVAQLARQAAAGAGEATIDRLQAVVARMYGLSRAQFARVLETFPLVEEKRREAALRLFEAREPSS